MTGGRGSGESRPPSQPGEPEPEGGGPRRVAVRLLLRGRVQGVGFRYFTLRLARRLGLAGQVRNLPDGGVEIEAAGEQAKVEDFKAAVRQGPPGAVVTAMREQPLRPEDAAWESFEIDH